MSLKFDEIKIDKKEFHKSKKTRLFHWNLIDQNKIIVSYRFELGEGNKYYIG